MPALAQARGRQRLPGLKSGCWPLGLIEAMAKESGGGVTRITIGTNIGGVHRLSQDQRAGFPLARRPLTGPVLQYIIADSKCK